MLILNKKEPILLFIGDILFFTISLWITLTIRQSQIPSYQVFLDHLIPFSYLFFIWVLVFFIAGFYERKALINHRDFFSEIFVAQIINSIIAFIFFYLLPIFGLAPKTIIFIYLVVSLILILIWRVYIIALLGIKRKLDAILIGRGKEMKQLKREVNNNSWYNLKFVISLDLDEHPEIDFQKEIMNPIFENKISTIVLDLKDEQLQKHIPHFYNLIFSKIKFLDIHEIYEDVFDKIPLSLIHYNWFLENVNSSQKRIYMMIKRTMDIVIALPLAIISLIFYPFVYLLLKIEGRGPIFYFPERIGRNNGIIKLIKFRTMTQTPTDGGEWGKDQNKVTKVGAFLRKWRIDELPQLWNVLRGDISLIGPRPEFVSAVERYEEEIPHYGIRHLITPGLSGWAQIYQKEAPHHETDIKLTTEKLSYDLFYIKNRSFLIDLKIALKTVKTLFSRSGS
ncbi:MAG: exopolysaccharide biosynthesis polyprenyl glycosylphosphotransferase [Candidatus Pacebacteria bacterium]|nr:exopolysaccharide biosynthesis polyprenyl glycosylphosphotransferase [Candidatus Paceibacterota bacterium]